MDILVEYLTVISWIISIVCSAAGITRLYRQARGLKAGDWINPFVLAGACWLWLYMVHI